MDRNIDISLLLDIYGNALPKVQRDSLDLYYNSDLSLGEIADNTGKTRQSVHDTLKRGEHTLRGMEKNLQILAKNQVYGSKIEHIRLLVRNLKNCSDVNEMKKIADLISDEVENLKI